MQPARFALRHRLTDSVTDYIADHARPTVHDVDIANLGETNDESEREREPTTPCRNW